MGFQKPTENELTEEQGKLLSQLTTIKSSFSLKLKRPKSLDVSQQISTFDYTKKLTESTLGAAAMDLFLKSFLDKLFDPNNDKLERMILRSMAKYLDKNDKKISPTQSNKDWLLDHALAPLNATFRVAKAAIVKKIITMIFGPKEKMDKDPVLQSYYLDAAICSSDMFSVSNPVSDSDGDFEFNKVELKKRLEKGEILFVISCQDVKIKLPETILNQADDVIANNSNPSKPKINPAIMFEQVNNTVTAEAQRINSPENSNSVRKSFMQILIEKIINLTTVAIQPYLPGIVNIVNSGPNGNLGVTANDFSPSPCDIRTMCVGDDVNFKKKSAFLDAMMNSIYAYLLSVIIQRLIKELKILIKKYILQKAQDRIKRKLAKRKFLSDESLQKLEKAEKFAEATKKLNGIFKFGEE
jgi:hypothetical protein